MQKELAEFHGKFKITADFDKVEDRELRMKLMKEEFEEYVEAMRVGDKVEVLDALADMVYLAFGDANVFGFDLDGASKEVHSSNMSKLDNNGEPIINGKNGAHDENKPIGKVLKSENFFEPDLAQFIQ